MALTFDWIKKCPSCSMVSRIEVKICPGCGNKTKRTRSYYPPLTADQKQQIIKLWNEGEKILDIINIIDGKNYNWKDIEFGGKGWITNARIMNLKRTGGWLHLFGSKADRQSKKKERKNIRAQETINNSYVVDEKGCWVAKKMQISISGLNQGRSKITLRRFLYQNKFGSVGNDEVIIRGGDCQKQCVNPSHCQKVSKLGEIYNTYRHLGQGRQIDCIEISTNKVFTFPSVRKAAEFIKGDAGLIPYHHKRGAPYKGYLFKYNQTLPPLA